MGKSAMKNGIVGIFSGLLMVGLVAGCGAKGGEGEAGDGNGAAANALSSEGTEAPAGLENAAAPVAAADTAEADIRALVDRVWGYYGKPFGANGGPVFEEVMTPALVAALKAQEDPEVGLGFDPFCGCQDYERSKHAIKSVAVTGDTARVAMDFWTFAQDGEARSFTIQLARTPKGWLIDDIVTPEGGLRR